MEKKKPMTWAELKEYCQKLSEDQLSETVRWWGDERGGVVYNIWELDEDYSNYVDEGFEPVSGYIGERDWDDITITKDMIIEEASVYIEKGTPVLNVDI